MKSIVLQVFKEKLQGTISNYLSLGIQVLIPGSAQTQNMHFHFHKFSYLGYIAKKGGKGEEKNVLLLLSAHIKRFSVSRTWDFFCIHSFLVPNYDVRVN